MSNNLSGKVAFITGANKGIGLETARGLAKLGVAVVIGSRDEARGQAAAETLRSEGIEHVEAVRFDVTHPEDHREIARHLDGRYGRLDALVNNAGVELEGTDFGSSINTTSMVTPEVLRQTFETNRPKWIAASLAFLRVLRRFPTRRLTVRFGGGAEPIRTPCLFVGNNEYELSPLAVGKRCRVDGGELWLCIVGPRDPIRFPRPLALRNARESKKAWPLRSKKSHLDKVWP